MKKFIVSTDEQLTRRYYVLYLCVTALLLAAIVLSVFRFGGAAEPAPAAAGAAGAPFWEAGEDASYEPYYLAGILAALHTRTGRLGFVAARPSPEECRYANAFALGAQSVRPDAAVLLAWTGTGLGKAMEERAVRLLAADGADVLAHCLPESAVSLAAERAGLAFIAPQRVPPGAVHALAVMEGGERLRLLPAADAARERAVVAAAGWRLRQGGVYVFAGEIYDNTGVRRCAADEYLGRGQRERMDWLVRGVDVVGN